MSLVGSGLLVAILAACGGGSGQQQGASTTAGSDECRARGEVLFTVLQCNTCHHADQPSAQGQPLNHLYGTTVTLTDGSELTRDDDYLFRSIRSPGAEIVAGFANVMPSYPALSDEDVRCLVEHLKSLP